MRIELKTRGLGNIIERARSVSKNVRAVLHNVGYELAECFKDNFRRLDKNKSKYGHNFYLRYGAGRTDYTVNKSLTGGSIIVRSYEMAHALRGGTVRAKNVTYLTIPVSEQAKSAKGGARDAGITGLTFAPTRKGGILYAENNEGNFTLHYVLRKSVTHRPRPYVIPPREELRNAIRRGINNASIF